MADPLPDRGLLRWLGFETDRPAKQGQALVNLIAADGQLRGPPRPPDGLAAQLFGLPFTAWPGQIDVFRDDRGGVMVR